MDNDTTAYFVPRPSKGFVLENETKIRPPELPNRSVQVESGGKLKGYKDTT